MAKAKKIKQLSFSLPNRVGLLAEVSALVASAKLNMQATCAYEAQDKAEFLIVAENTARARKALERLGVEIKEEEAVLVEMPNKAGELQKVAQKIAGAGINITYMYATAFTGKTSACIFRTSENARAVRAINS